MLISIPVAYNFGLSFFIDIIIQPDPVPTSKRRFDVSLSVNFKTSSTMISVSGLGIKTSLLTLKLLFQKSLFLKI